MSGNAIDPKWYRQVLGQYPTGVCVITAAIQGAAIGMVVGSFTSVSLDPPLIAFLPDKNSSTWARLSRSRRFCVNILSAEQETVCRRLASREPDKFDVLGSTQSPNGSPLIDGVVAWIDCDLHSVSEAGDHYIVLGLISTLDIATGGLPLLFFQGGYGRFAPASLVASDTHGLLTEHLRIVDLARPAMERIAAAVGGQCTAMIRLDNELIIAASAGQAIGPTPPVPVGRRLPFAPPLGSTFAAWLPGEQIDGWIGAGVERNGREAFHDALAKVRARGFAVAVPQGSELQEFADKFEEVPVSARYGDELEDFVRALEVDPAGMAADLGPEVRMISAPIFDPDQRVVLSLTIQGFATPAEQSEAQNKLETLLAGAGHITELLHRRKP